MSRVVLAARGLSRTYDNGVAVRAVADVTLDVTASALTAIAGPSGSGKSTLLGLLGLLDVPTAGEVIVDGRVASSLGDKGRSRVRSETIGFVFQQFNLIGDLDAVTNVETALLYRGLSPTQRRGQAIEALQVVGLEGRLEHRPNQLSGGEQQRVAIARAAVTHPRVILADEPTGNLDTDTSDRVLDLLDRLVDDGTGVVVVTHDPTIVARAGQRYRMRDGRLVTDRW